MSSGAGETSASLLIPQLRLITKYCAKIPVARKETKELGDLCTVIINYITQRSLTPRHSGYDELKSELTVMEKELGIWSKYNYPKCLYRRGEIEAGTAKFVEKLKSIFPQSPNPQNTAVYSPGGHGVNPSNRSSVAGSQEWLGSAHDDHEPSSRQTAEPETLEQPRVAIRRLDGEITKERDMPFVGGLHCEVWVGYWREGGGEPSGGEATGGAAGGEKVALKALRIHNSPAEARKRLERELPKWAGLRHQNILPLYGVVTNFGTRLYMVYPWRENGNLLDYVKKNRRAKKNNLLRGSAAGLSHLHTRGIVHGSVKCNNVLVSDEGEPQICDFGVARILEETNEPTVSKTMSSAILVRYAAPELLENNNNLPTMQSDVYSFAMLILECITEEPPFSNIAHDAGVIHARLTKRQYPSRPEGEASVPSELWDYMEGCWSDQPENRPTMDQVHHFFVESA